MKKIILLLSIIILSNMELLSFENDSTKTNQINEIEEDESSGLECLLSGGFGIITDGGDFGFFGNSNNFGFAKLFTLSFETPFSNESNFNFELFSHIWFANYLRNGNPNEYKNNYIHIDDRLYSQYAFSGIIKYYLMDRDKKFRISLHCGLVIYSHGDNYYGFNYGISCSWKIMKNYNFIISRRSTLGGFTIGGPSGTDVPNFFTFELQYIIK